jgi:hypothetical protein
MVNFSELFRVLLAEKIVISTRLDDGKHGVGFHNISKLVGVRG